MVFGFDLPKVRVEMDGVELFDLGAADCPELAGIAWFDFQGGFRAESIEIGRAENLGRGVLGGLVHVAPFDVEGWALDPTQERQEVVLSIAGMTEPPASIVEPRPDLVGRSGGGRAPMGVRLMLPGRVWAAAGDGPLALALTVNGRACGAPLSIARGEMVRAFEMTLGRNGAEDDARTALLCLEHVAEGGFWSALSDGARAVLGRIADQYGLQELLPEGVARLPELPQMPLDVALAEEAFLAMVAQHRAAGDRDVADLLDRVPALPPEARRELYLMLTDLFCAEGAFGALHARAASEGLAEMGEGGDPWHRSLRLPWLMAESAMERVELLLRRITGEAGAWISMASVCWTARQAVESLQPSLAIARREVLVEGFLDFLDVHAGSYWGRATGRQMIEAAIGLLAAGGGCGRSWRGGWWRRC